MTDQSATQQLMLSQVDLTALCKQFSLNPSLIMGESPTYLWFDLDYFLRTKKYPLCQCYLK